MKKKTKNLKVNKFFTRNLENTLENLVMVN